MSVFSHDNYMGFLKSHLKTLPKEGHGELKKWAQLLNMSSTMITQIMSGDRLLIPDHAYDFKNYFGWSELETDYFIVLIQIERAQKQSFKDYLLKKKNELKNKSQNLSQRVNFDRQMTDVEQATFYSSWMYSAIRLFCSTNETGKTLLEITKEFKITQALAEKYLQFLVEVKLCDFADGRYKMGLKRTHISSDSPQIVKHHTSWRLRAIENLEKLTTDELTFTGPLSLSEKDFQVLREKMVQLIKETYEIVAKSPAERVGCFNLDLFYITGKQQ